MIWNSSKETQQPSHLKMTSHLFLMANNLKEDKDSLSKTSHIVILLFSMNRRPRKVKIKDYNKDYFQLPELDQQLKVAYYLCTLYIISPLIVLIHTTLLPLPSIYLMNYVFKFKLHECFGRHVHLVSKVMVYIYFGRLPKRFSTCSGKDN